MRPTSCHLLAALDVEEPCPGKQCAFWDDSCLLTGLRSDMTTNPVLVRFLLRLREDLEDGARPFFVHTPGFD